MINRLCQKQSLGIASGRVAGAGQWRSIHQSSYICPESRIISHLHYYPKYWNMIVNNDKYFVRSARTFYRAFDPVRPVPSATIFLLVLLFLSRHPWSPLPPVIPVVVVVETNECVNSMTRVSYPFLNNAPGKLKEKIGESACTELELCSQWIYQFDSNQPCACHYPGVSISPDKSLYLHALHKTLNLISSSPELSCLMVCNKYFREIRNMWRPSLTNAKYKTSNNMVNS